MKDLNHKIIRPAAAFVIVYCLLFSTLVTPLAATRPANIITPESKFQPDINPAESEAQTRQKIRRDFGNIPLSFEQNIGQTESSVKFLVRSLGYTMFFTETGAVMKMRRQNGEKVSESVLQMEFGGAHKSPRIE